MQADLFPFLENAMNGTQTISRNNFCVKPLVACLMLPLAIGDLACRPGLAATLHVTNCNDAGSGSLRAALGQARSGDSVDLTALSCGTISLAIGEPQVPVDDLTLHSLDASALTIAGSQVARPPLLRALPYRTRHLAHRRVADHGRPSGVRIRPLKEGTRGKAYKHRPLTGPDR
jgi:hypothetical protein